MKAILDSTAIIHSNTHFSKIESLLRDNGISSVCITRINYLEILAGAERNAKIEIRKFLNQFAILNLTDKVFTIADKLAMQYVVNKRNRKDFLIAAIAIANNLPLVTQNDKDYHFDGLQVLSYDTHFKLVRKVVS
jgi:predicted nucleic acid-binding protein